ncbi:MAG: ribosome assembly cofactor RimP [Bacteroidales bacterium]|jgi:ribosome maturation factor RimP|nr:ribosome assembly cofactor RimP [Bacteroidales bacterium]MDD4771378.1 ribosome assembly cofactor RimP [Bacteroidales bacterium]HKL92965.1 ribosome assembly cofactor RimP [Bacteroidales bacterium]
MQKNALIGVIEAWMNDSSFFLVDVRINQNNDIVVEFESDSEPVTIEDCIALTRHIEAQFDREVEDYSLEVGSAGFGQAFKVLRQYEMNVGEAVDVLARDGKKWTGILCDVTAEGFGLEVTRKVKLPDAKKPVLQTETLHFTYEDVNQVKNVVTFS